ncbi:hypothetical protein BJ741DRAFT_332870 [Chytriomyces cf. hyalinus JEL632]|nr:hypothetical protein BJ741DRAFT_332870 [Chytriomyces cf. hyalinus JEL632]
MIITLPLLLFLQTIVGALPCAPIAATSALLSTATAYSSYSSSQHDGSTLNPQPLHQHRPPPHFHRPPRLHQQPLPLSADSVPAAPTSSTASRFTCRAAHAVRSAPLPGSISSSRQHQAVSSRHAAALEALKPLLRNKAVNQNGNALKGAARRLERAWAGCG